MTERFVIFLVLTVLSAIGVYYAALGDLND
jgi:hypothetical protein